MSVHPSSEPIATPHPPSPPVSGPGSPGVRTAGAVPGPPAPALDLAALARRPPPRPWSCGGKLPWHEPGFSARMLREHLTQRHDRASRRFATIDAHVAWIHAAVCFPSAAILDLGCGPGLYTRRLARLGHRCVGIDISPASIAHARDDAERARLDCTYVLGDMRDVDPGGGFDVALLLFGEFNTFPPHDARLILERTRRFLGPTGVLVLEVHTEARVRELGSAPPTWYAAERGLFLDEPHLCLVDSCWHEPDRASAERFTVVSRSPDRVETRVCTTQAYSHDEYAAILSSAGFASVSRQASLRGDDLEEEGLVVYVART